MPKDYTPVIDRVAHIEQACADVRRLLANASLVVAASAADTDGQSEEIALANDQVAEYETAARGHLDDISNHVTQALALVWGSPAVPSGPVVSGAAAAVPTAVSPPAAAPAPAETAAPAAPAADAAPPPAAPVTSTTPAPAADASAAPSASSTPTS